MTSRHVAVVDIGKTNAKLALVDLAGFREIDVRRTPNNVRVGPPYPHVDVEALWAFILDGLAAFQTETGVDAIVVTAHGATGALVDADGRLALPILDYEYEAPQALREDYAKFRPPFAETGSPPRAAGLNLGAQLFWQAKTFPEDFSRAATFLPYPQYWSFRLSGVRAAEMTSLGAHGDLWNPEARTYSSLVDRMGWSKLMPPVRKASDRLGPVTADVATRTGLAQNCLVYCGIHDSNASLLPHLLTRKPPFAVVSTGTWVISMAIGGRRVTLDEMRDTFVNVNAFGDPVPSARYMGGREFSMLIDDPSIVAEPRELDRIAADDLMLMPSVLGDSGPFPGRKHYWIGNPDAAGPAGKLAAVSAYMAMMTATSLELIGAEGPSIVEGPLAENGCFMRVLATATGQPVISGGKGATGTALGAALLIDPQVASKLDSGGKPVEPDAAGSVLHAYVGRWHDRAAKVERGGFSRWS
jgi:sugar (pentulose or hexulose) kinase